jgi:hypothetical protein
MMDFTDPKLSRISPHRFYDLVAIHQRVTAETQQFLDEFGYHLAESRVDIEADYDEVRELYNRFVQEAESGTRHRVQSEWATSEEQRKSRDPYRNTLSGASFLAVVNSLAKLARDSFENLQSLVELLRPMPLILSSDRPNLGRAFSFRPEIMQQMAYEIQVNNEAVSRFVTGVMGLRDGRKEILKTLDRVIRLLDGYYNVLVQRHSTEGVPIFRDPLLTDLAVCIYENIDSHGEIESGVDPDKVSAYSVKKATVLIEAAKSGKVGEFVSDPAAFIEYVKGMFRTLWEKLGELETRFEAIIQDTHKVVDPYAVFSPILDSNLDTALGVLDVMDPRSVAYRDPGKLMSSEEKHAHNFWTETIETIVAQLAEGDPPQALVQYILQRKFELREWQQDENSFYVCRIGSGNQFRGVAPGALEVIPGNRPTVNIDEIIGSGFDEVRTFVEQVESAAKWHDLFVATSPSRTADKSNVLLIGPQGCGKTEVLRAVGADKRSISIFAQGSDFNTCWLGEASKNPKRLFQAGMKLQKKADKHVHFLIDEIDAILNNDRQNAGYINLTLEFQILMDGVVQYPRLSVWGTTNNPNRIPMPMIRRFSKVAIVGELDTADRVRLLKHFTGFMPFEDISEEAWAALAERLDGATGDVIRKIVDTVWRETVTDFVTRDPENAERMVQWLNRRGRFEVGGFNNRDRHEFKSMLALRGALARADQLSDSVDQALDNMAILHEIETAKMVYEDAKLFMASVTEERGGGSCDGA